MRAQPLSLQIRIGTEADTENITRLINEAFRPAESFFIDEDRIDNASVQRSMETGEFLLAESDKHLVGCVFIEPRDEGTYLGLLSVEPMRQQSGIASQLMTYAEARCKDQEREFIEIYTVSLRLDLSGFYKKRGYVETGTLPFPPDISTKVPCHFVVMRKMLSKSH
ncbi:MAG TPA: GNAT family N-acetyltransferase [Pyrinomonadaceae bacterium]